MKALVTGAAGFVGVHVVDALLAAGADIRGFDIAEVRLARLPMSYSSAKAAAELGYTWRPAAEALAAAVAWFSDPPEA